MWDLSLPGYKYLGPGNKLDKGKPNNYNDHVAEVHDWDYDYIQNTLKKNPYRTWSNADDRFVKRVKLSGIGGYGSYAYFKSKQAAHQLGFIEHVGDRSTQQKRKFNPQFGESEQSKRLRVALPRDEKPRLRGATQHERSKASLPNLQASAAMGDGEGGGAGSGNDAGLKETPIDDPYMVYRGPPDYTFASLPYSETRMNFLSTTSSVDHVFRMTSVYDCRVETAAADYNVGVGTQNIYAEAETTQLKARWFDYYAGMYNYYHVIGCQYNVFIENLSGEPIWVYKMFYNDDLPNGAATNEDIQLWQGVEYKYLDRRYLAVTSGGLVETGEAGNNERHDEVMTEQASSVSYETGNHVGNDGVSKTVFGGEYKAGDFRREIRLDSVVENWTAINTNPSLPEKILIRIKPVNERHNANNAGNAGDTLKYKIQVKLNYLVEFKELATALRYPVARQPITVTLSSDADTATA